MKVKALKVFGDGKRLYIEGEVTNMTKEWYEILNATPNGPLLEAIQEDKNEGVDVDGNSNRTRASQSKTRNKNNS